MKMKTATSISALVSSAAQARENVLAYLKARGKGSYLFGQVATWAGGPCILTFTLCDVKMHGPFPVVPHIGQALGAAGRIERRLLTAPGRTRLLPSGPGRR